MSGPEQTVLALLARRAVTLDQLLEAQHRRQRRGGSIEDALLALGHVTPHQLQYARVRCCGPATLDLAGLTVPVEVLELLPESVARENVLLPLAQIGRTLILAAADPNDDLIQKLEFILNRPVTLLRAERGQIVEAIDQHYGWAETESVDSMLAEFTDTAIDFSETEAPSVSALSDGVQYELCLDEDEAAGKRPLVSRRATVRYYHRMCPERTFPLLVVLSRDEVRRVAKAGVSQNESAPFQVAQGSFIEIEPVLPGCDCYPRVARARVEAGDTTTTFWVVPHVLGEVMQARVVIRQGEGALAEVPLQARVARQTVTLLAGAMGLVAPFVLMLLKHFELDFESQAKDGFSVYAGIAGWLVRWLSPEALGASLLLLALGLYLWLRPRRRDVFWDVTLQRSPGSGSSPPARQPEPVVPVDEDWRMIADRCHADGHHAEALAYYERGLGRPEARARDYFRASLSAYHLGEVRRALGILRQAEACLPSGEMRAAVWYNMGCFASQLGLTPEALRYLRRAADAGMTDPRKYRDDPDLTPLRWHAGFKELLVGMNG